MYILSHSECMDQDIPFPPLIKFIQSGWTYGGLTVTILFTFIMFYTKFSLLTLSIVHNFHMLLNLSTYLNSCYIICHHHSFCLYSHHFST